MAEIKQIVHLDLTGQQIWNAGFQTLGTAPSTPFVGQFYYNTATSKFEGWNGTIWVDLGDMYSHPSFPGAAQPGTALSGAQVISQVTTNNGHVTGVVTRNLTAADISASAAVHTHAFTDILGLPTQTILGNNTGGTAAAKALTVGDILTMLSIAYGSAALLTTGTDTSQRTWSAKMIADYITSRLGTYITVVNLALGTRTSTTLPITNSAGTGFTLPVATTTLAGLMSAADKVKLDGVATGANLYVHPTANPGAHPFASQISSGVQVLSKLAVNNEGHVIEVLGRNLTKGDLAAVMIADASNTATDQTWSAQKIYGALQAAIASATTGALVYQPIAYAASATTGVVIAPSPVTAGTIKAGMVWVVTTGGFFGTQAVDPGDMIIAKVDSAGTTESNYQLVNKNIPAIVSAATTVEGIVFLATTAEAIAGVENTKAVTPYGLKQALLNYIGGYYTTFGNGSGTSFSFAHGLGTDKVIVQTRITASGKPVIMEAYADATNVYMNMNVAPATGEYAVLVTKI